MVCVGWRERRDHRLRRLLEKALGPQMAPMGADEQNEFGPAFVGGTPGRVFCIAGRVGRRRD